MSSKDQGMGEGRVYDEDDNVQPPQTRHTCAYSNQKMDTHRTKISDADVYDAD